jgi:hypothetical protein
LAPQLSIEQKNSCSIMIVNQTLWKVLLRYHCVQNTAALVSVINLWRYFTDLLKEKTAGIIWLLVLQNAFWFWFPELYSRYRTMAYSITQSNHILLTIL